MAKLFRTISLAPLLVAGVLAGSATAAPKKETPATPALVASFGDWQVYVGAVGKGKICYLLNQPKLPGDTKRDKVYAFISNRPAEGVKNEVSFIMGGEIAPPPAATDKAADKKKGTPAVVAPLAVVGDKTFDMLPKGADLWIKNPASEPDLIDAMRKGQTIVVKATLKKTGSVSDSYALAGFDKAVDRLNKECSGK